ncbi:MAG: ABC transporter permease [Saprospiraceae bacterium]|nr:ABC transporter permease [Saprospiraceae bacterium]
MNSWHIAQRLMNYEKGSFVRFILRLAYASTALSVAVMIVAIAVISGFNKEISNKIFGFWGHIQVNSIHSSQLNLSDPIEFDTAFTKVLDTLTGVQHYQVFAFMPAVVTAGDELDGLILKGVGKDFDWAFFKKFLVSGHIPDFHDSTSRYIIFSKSLASRLKLSAGERCKLNFVIDEQVITRTFTIAGIYSTGLEEYDQKLALADISELQSLAGWTPTQIGGYELFVSDLKNVDQIADNIYENYLGEELYVETIRQKFPSIFDWLNLQGTNQYVIQILMLVVAMINLVTVLLILILERTRMIGTLKALGMKNGPLKKIFLMHGFQILSRGLIWGNIIGILVCLVQQFGKIIKLNEADYYLSVAPIHLNLWSVVFLNLGTILMTLLILWIPTGLITRISPLKAIGYR